MIRANYKVDKLDNYTYLEVSGHADYDKYGKDLVCASVSSIIFGLMNCIDEFVGVTIKKEKNHIEIINKSESEKISDYLRLTIIQLKTIEESYGKFIKVERKWVWNIY